MAPLGGRDQALLSSPRAWLSTNQRQRRPPSISEGQPGKATIVCEANNPTAHEGSTGAGGSSASGGGAETDSQTLLSYFTQFCLKIEVVVLFCFSQMHHLNLNPQNIS